ncbi:MAG: M20 family metallopeptidase, partial [Actinobacteria bacterium]|nr:M20 family metallopeptidase [Actinomycetota bacterium]
ENTKKSLNNLSEKDILDLKKKLNGAIDGMSKNLIEMSGFLYHNPEIAGEEFKAARLITDELEKNGFKVKKGISGLTTSFIAVYNCSGKGPSLSFLSEYEALPNLGHGSGHNITSIISAGAAIALSRIADCLSGRIICIGTPGESKFNSKLLMVNDGIFNNIDVVMISQAGDRHCINPIFLANDGIQFTFIGKASHAAAAPQEGINALDAVIMLFNSVHALRQQLNEDARIHGIVSKGGEAVNIIPDLAIAQFSIRAKTRKYLNEIVEKVKNCARGAAIQTGAKLKISFFEKSVDDYAGNELLIREYSRNLTELGEAIDPEPKLSGSSDIGNLSYLMPSICPVVKIAPEGVGLHTLEMAQSSFSKTGTHGLIAGTKALSMTGMRILADNDFYNAVRMSFKKLKNGLKI